MIKEAINIVWLKRDLRLQDHQSLYLAEKAGIPYTIIYLFEPSMMQNPDTSLRHLQFVYQTIKSLNKKLEMFHREVTVFYGEALEVFHFILTNYHLKQLFSYQESGTKITWNRDKSIQKFCLDNHIHWIENQRDGIIRGLKNRANWNQRWHTTMHAPILKNTYSKNTIKHVDHSFELPEELVVKLENYPKQYQPAGEGNAWKYLKSFTQKRGFNYHRHISKPTQSRMACSRLSPYLAWGNLSIKQVFQFVGTHPNGTANDRAFSGMLTRLHWHCHFIQKFEVECSYETHCINKGYELLPHIKNEDFLKAWKTGQTGYLSRCLYACC